MITKSIIYSESRESYSSSTGLKSWIKMGVEVELSPGDSVTDAINYAKEIVKGEIVSNQPPEQVSEGVPIEQVQKTPKEQAIDSQIEAINGCTSLKSLEIFKKLVERETDINLSSAYEIKRLELTNKNA